MKKVVLLALLMLLSAVHGYGADEYDFRNMNWGMSPKDVFEREKTAFYDEGRWPRELLPEDINSVSNLFYKDIIHGSDFDLNYYFKDKKLIGAAYVYLFKPTDNFDTELEKLYFFHNELKSKYGRSLVGIDANGKGGHVAVFMTERRTVILQSMPPNSKINGYSTHSGALLSIYYKPTDPARWKERLQRAAKEKL